LFKIYSSLYVLTQYPSDAFFHKISNYFLQLFIATVMGDFGEPNALLSGNLQRGFFA